MLESQVEDEWLSRTIQKYLQENTDYILPSIVVLASSHTIALAELLELTLGLELLNPADGIDQLQTILDRDPSPGQLMHLRLQLEVGALAAHAGQHVTFELPSKEGSGPADVVMGLDVEKVVVEAKAILLDDPTRVHHDSTDRLFERLHEFELRYQVECAGDFEEKLEGADLESFLLTAEVCARKAHELHDRQVMEGWGSSVMFGEGLGSGLHGPVHRTLTWRRTRWILRKKAWQSRHQVSVWLRVDALDGLWQFTPWANMALPNKLETLMDPVREALASFPHVAGIVITSGAAHAQSVFFGESFRQEDSYALRRLIEPLRVRETMIITMNQEAASAAEMWCRLYDEEPAWLKWALQREGLPSANEIFG